MKVVITYYDINGEDKSVLLDIFDAGELGVAINTLAQGGNFIINVDMGKTNG